MADIKKFNEILASCILVAIVVCAILLLGFFVYRKYTSEAPQSLTIEYIIQTDSTGVVSVDAYQIAETIQTYIDKHEHLLDDKYKHILEQKENIHDYLTWGGILITLVLSIFGFFGYKSLSSIEERITDAVESKASKKASDTAEEYAKKRFDEYERHTDKILSDKEKINEGKLDCYKESTKDALVISITNSLNKAQGQMRKDMQRDAEDAVRDAYNKSLSDKVNDVETNSKLIESLEKDMAYLTRQFDELKARLSIVESKNSISHPSNPLSTSKTTTIVRDRRDNRNPNPYKK